MNVAAAVCEPVYFLWFGTLPCSAGARDWTQDSHFFPSSCLAGPQSPCFCYLHESLVEHLFSPTCLCTEAWVCE